MAFPTPAQSQNFDGPAPEPYGLARLILLPGRFRDPWTRRRKSLAAPSLSEEIHASSEVTFCFWSWPHSFFRCFPPDGSRILSCDRTIPLMYVPNEHLGNLRGGYGRGGQKQRSGASNVVASGHFVRGTAHLARRLSAFRLPLFFHSRPDARTSVDRVPRKDVFFGPSTPNARESFAFRRVGAEPCAPSLPVPAQHRPARAALLLSATDFSGAPGL